MDLFFFHAFLLVNLYLLQYLLTYLLQLLLQHLLLPYLPHLYQLTVYRQLRLYLHILYLLWLLLSEQLPHPKLVDFVPRKRKVRRLCSRR